MFFLQKSIKYDMHTGIVCFRYGCYSLLWAQERPATLILTVTSGLRFTRARHVNKERTESGS